MGYQYDSHGRLAALTTNNGCEILADSFLCQPATGLAYVGRFGNNLSRRVTLDKDGASPNCAARSCTRGLPLQPGRRGRRDYR